MSIWQKIGLVAIMLFIIFMALGVLYYFGYLDNLGWETLTMIGAAASAPYIMFRNWLRDNVFSSKSKNRIKESEQVYLKLRLKEQEKRKKLNAIINEKDKQLEKLRKEVGILHLELKDLQTQRKEVKSDVNKLSTDELLTEFDEEF